MCRPRFQSGGSIRTGSSKRGYQSFPINANLSYQNGFKIKAGPSKRPQYQSGVIRALLSKRLQIISKRGHQSGVCIKAELCKTTNDRGASGHPTFLILLNCIERDRKKSKIKSEYMASSLSEKNRSNKRIPRQGRNGYTHGGHNVSVLFEFPPHPPGETKHRK